MKISAKSPDEFFVNSGSYEPIFRELDRIIREEAPELKPQLHSGMSMTMMGYGMFHYKGASGREGDWPVIALAPQKNYASLYVCVVKDGKYLAEIYGDKLGKVNCGKSCIRFKKPDDLNLDTVRIMLGDIVKQQKSGKSFFGV